MVGRQVSREHHYRAPRSKVVFQTTYDHAPRVFAREFGRSVSEDDFMNLGRFEVLSLATDEGVSAPVSGETLTPTAPTDETPRGNDDRGAADHEVSRGGSRPAG